MDKCDFKSLCERIIDVVDREEFKPQIYMQEMFEGSSQEDNQTSRKKRRMSQAYTETCGGYINGKTEVVITIRLMSGGSFLDIAATIVADTRRRFSTQRCNARSATTRLLHLKELIM